ncbi:uncharacterized protein V1516DRAFT_687226 [Lipomyces oligophaga]|uniref:uncharacterized protein n=1 Tax=Lipomyces oligophaga TaxID=45792 RepID=UPI0034CE453C
MLLNRNARCLYQGFRDLRSFPEKQKKNYRESDLGREQGQVELEQLIYQTNKPLSVTPNQKSLDCLITVLSKVPEDGGKKFYQQKWSEALSTESPQSVLRKREAVNNNMEWQYNLFKRKDRFSRKFQTPNEDFPDIYQGEIDDRYRRMVIRFWPPLRSLNESYGLRQYLSKLGNLLEFEIDWIYDGQVESNNFAFATFDDENDVVFGKLEQLFSCFGSDNPNILKDKEGEIDQSRIIQQMELDCERAWVFSVHRSAHTIEEINTRTLIKDLKISGSDDLESLHKLESYRNTRLCGFKGFGTGLPERNHLNFNGWMDKQWNQKQHSGGDSDSRGGVFDH